MLQIDLLEILLIALFVGFAIRGARQEGRSPLLWAMISLGTWLIASQLLDGGIPGGLLSQFLMIAGLTASEMLRERKTDAEADRRATQSKS